jgi:methionyl-tRNA formyltransferase
VIVFLGTFDGVLEALAEYMHVDQVVSQQGKLRNAKLQWRLQNSGVQWGDVGNRAEFDQWVERQGRIDLCVVAGFSYILRQPFLDKCGCVINFHPGLLHQCRGPQPVAAAILSGHAEYGVSVHRIDSEAIDAGPIIETRTMPIDYNKTYARNYQAIKSAMAGLAGDLFARHGAKDWPQGENWRASDEAYFPRFSALKLAELARAPNLQRWQI